MIHYNKRFNSAILVLRETLRDNHFDLLVRELKLPLSYFREPGFIYYRHSIDQYLARFDKKHQFIIELFCLQQSIPADELVGQLFSKGIFDDLIELGLLIEEDDKVRTDCYGIVPFLGNFFITTIGTARSIGAYLSRQSYIFAPNLFTEDYENFLDLGSGCGVLAILAGHRAKHAVGVDIMPEATEVARTNAVLNSVDDRVDFYCGDMYQPVAEMKFDSIVAHTPYAALPEKYRGMVVISNSEDGLGFLRRLIDGMYRHQPKVVRMIANGLGNESQPLLSGLLANSEFVQKGYQAKLLIYSKGLLDDSFILDTAKLVVGIYRDRGEVITEAEVITDIKELYQRLKIDSYYGIILEFERNNGNIISQIESIDMANKYKLDMSPVFRSPVEVFDQRAYLAKLNSTTFPLSVEENQMIELLRNGQSLSGIDKSQQLELYYKLERVLGVSVK